MIRIAAALALCALLAVAAQAQPRGVAPPRPATAAGCVKSTFRVAIDVGHYLAAPGATSARGITEFTYNRALAEMVLRAVKEAGFTGSFLIGDTGDMSSLSRRPAIAREQGAALFVSLHHDSVQKQYLSTWMFDGARARLQRPLPRLLGLRLRRVALGEGTAWHWHRNSAAT